MDEQRQFTNRCACGWDVTGSQDLVVDATIEHGRMIHNMEATRDQVLAVLHAGGVVSPESAAGDTAPGSTAPGATADRP